MAQFEKYSVAVDVSPVAAYVSYSYVDRGHISLRV